VEVGHGLIVRAICDQSLSIGMAVSAAVRPEKVHINSTAKLDNEFRGRVISIVYIGTDTHYGVRLASDQLVRVREQNNTPGSRPVAKEGDEVTVSFDSAAARILTE
jgi:spermidine/putrescine transport system ATP-binding protein